jgi:hypothetical protein
MSTDAPTNARGCATPRIAIGICLTLVGGLLLLDNVRLLVDAIDVMRLWPLALTTRVLLDMLGWCLSVALTPFSLAATWPLALMIWGGAMIWRALAGDHRGVPGGGQEKAHVS